MSRKRHTPADEPFFLIRTFSGEFRSGASLEPHAHSWGQLIYAASGVLSVWTAQGSWVVPPHWAVWAPPGVAHAMHFHGATSLRTLYVRPGMRNEQAASTVITVSPLLRELIVRATEVRMLDSRQPIHVAMVDLIVNELRTHATPALDLPMPQSEVLRRVADHLVATPLDQRPHDALAQQFALSARTMERGFLKETGLPLGTWRRQARFQSALRSLGGGASVKEAAADAGYQSPSAFIAAFRAAFQTTPGRYFDAGRPL